MNLARVHGPTRLSKNLKSSNASMIFKILLKGYLIGRSNLFKQIRGGEYQRLNALVCLTMCHALTHTNKMGQPSESIVILLM
jgi:hypothetical protein